MRKIKIFVFLSFLIFVNFACKPQNADLEFSEYYSTKKFPYVTRNLVAYFDPNRHSVEEADSTPNKIIWYNSWNSNGTLISSVSNGNLPNFNFSPPSFNFNGTSFFSDTGFNLLNNTTNTTKLTIQVAVNPSSSCTTTQPCTIISDTNSSSTSSNFKLSFSSSSYSYSLSLKDNNMIADSYSVIVSPQYSGILTVVVDVSSSNDFVKFYLHNNNSIQTSTPSPTENLGRIAFDGLAVGAEVYNTNSKTNFFNGNIGEILIYNDVLNDQEIMYNVNNMLPKYP